MEQFRLVLAVILSTAILFGWQYFFASPTPNFKPVEISATIDNQINISPKRERYIESIVKDLSEILKQDFEQSKRVRIFNEYVSGSINLQGARLDDLILLKYKQDLNTKDKVVLLSPQNTQKSYFAEFGWLSINNKFDLPNNKTIWKVDNTNSFNTVNLYWINDQGIKFTIKITLDDNYLFNINQGVENSSSEDIVVYPYASVNRSYGQNESNAMVHEGAIAVVDNQLTEYSFSDLKEESIEKKQQKGWIGFSDKYWLVSILPDSNALFNAKLTGFSNKYQAYILKNKITISPGQSFNNIIRLFAGAKNIDLLHKYQNQYHIPLFDRAVDFGILYFITKPIFLLLNYFYSVVGNFGVAILILTIFIKVLLFPLAYKGFINMNRLKVLQPQLVAIKERYSNDTVAFQKAVMELYKKEKVNPMSGCLPLFLQMPVFFALYKVLSVTIEMRHAPFFWWLKDLSAPDPTTIFNLFGLLPWHAPSFLMIGVLPMLMAITMHMQQSLNPAPADPTQARVMKYLPLIFLFVFASFPSGLVIYWTWSNILSIIQQIVIKRLCLEKK
ncbi:MAG: membrane protein insertase YidC [Candidatus Midichloria sp.]|nr:MAG: membrane protein insertase YidC [Candidatus Midichloria sp.]